MKLLCRNVVADYDAWREVFDAHEPARRDAGLELLGLWRSVDDDRTIFFLMEVADRSRAEAFMDQPSSVEARGRAGVLEGEVHFLDEVRVP